jgi:hypothetical protein
MVTYLLQSYFCHSFVICSPWQIIFVAQIAGYNESCQFHFVCTTFITVRQHPASESRKPHGYISGGENRVQRIFLVSQKNLTNTTDILHTTYTYYKNCTSI